MTEAKAAQADTYLTKGYYETLDQWLEDVEEYRDEASAFGIENQMMADLDIANALVSGALAEKDRIEEINVELLEALEAVEKEIALSGKLIDIVYDAIAKAKGGAA